MDDPWPGATYNGFSGAAAPMEAPPARRGLRKPVIVAAVGVAVAAGLGLATGVMTRKDLAPATSPKAVPIEVANVAPPETRVASTPLEVLPPDMAQAAAARPVLPLPLPPPAPPAPREAAIAAPAVQASARAPDVASSRADPGFNCQSARSRSEELVCADPQLARLDRRLNQAFQDAVAAGAPYGDLQAEQDDWLRIREDAARRAGPAGVASVYRQRIAELREIAGY